MLSLALQACWLQRVINPQSGMCHPDFKGLEGLRIAYECLSCQMMRFIHKNLKILVLVLYQGPSQGSFHIAHL